LLSQDYAKYCFTNKKTFIDLGADFRLESEEEYKKWYGGEFKYAKVHQAAVYALPELFRENIIGSNIIANPGCYPTSVALGLAPLVANKLVDCTDILIDAKSGVTGAGRGLSQNTHFPDCNESFAPYKIGEHRHTPEIEQILEKLCDSLVSVTFVPHLLPVNRGILSTMYTNPIANIDIEEIYKLYTDFYEKEQFVRVMDIGETANIKNTVYSNYCDISLHKDRHSGKIIIVSALDNMVKGAAGQAVQNMNIVCGFEEILGLDFVPPAF
ncbi:MAG: N-acetyl-gamma-glutamyl-phosphate reductase, partial [Clostridiales bacterium]|nr:N-acetyl-gamma-glutamyl-phosphate reductase [Clostridiales bacterium]